MQFLIDSCRTLDQQLAAVRAEVAQHHAPAQLALRDRQVQLARLQAVGSEQAALAEAQIGELKAHKQLLTKEVKSLRADVTRVRAERDAVLAHLTSLRATVSSLRVPLGPAPDLAAAGQPALPAAAPVPVSLPTSNMGGLSSPIESPASSAPTSPRALHAMLYLSDPSLESLPPPTQRRGSGASFARKGK